MKLLSLALVLASFSVHASNPVLEAIYNQYSSTLKNHRVGMTSTVKTIESIFINQGDSEPTSINSSSKRVILKVDGDKFYYYELEYTEIDGQNRAYLIVDDRTGYKNEVEEYSSDIKINNNILETKINIIYNEGLPTMTQEIYTKNLLSPHFCDSKMEGTQTTAINGHTIETPILHEIKCGADMSIPEMKKINLKNIYFCDNTQEPVPCSYKDMSYLTNSL